MRRNKSDATVCSVCWLAPKIMAAAETARSFLVRRVGPFSFRGSRLNYTPLIDDYANNERVVVAVLL